MHVARGEKGEREREEDARGCDRKREEAGCVKWIGGGNGHERDADAKRRSKCVCIQVRSGSCYFLAQPSPFFALALFACLRCAGVAAVAQPMTGKKRAI